MHANPGRLFLALKVAVLYYIGMAGHFALGNSNSLATIDVAGAFIVISSPLCTTELLVNALLNFIQTITSLS